MLTHPVYLARLEQEKNLIQRYQAVIDQQKATIDSIRADFDIKIAGINQQQLVFDQKQKLLTVYMEYLTNYLHLWESYTPTDLDAPLKAEYGKTRLSRDGTEVTFRTLIDRQHKAYQERIVQCAQGIIEDYKAVLSNRMTVLVEDTFIIYPQSQALIDQELERFSAALYNPVVAHYQSFVFPQTEALVRDCLCETQADFLEIQNQYVRCLDAQPVVVERSNCFQSDTQEKIELLRVQYLELLPSDVSSMIYTWCGRGDLQALAQHLQDNTESPFHVSAYLKHHAPEALHRACGANQLMLVKQLLDEGVKPMPDRYAYPPVHYAALSSHDDTIPILEALYQQDHQTMMHTGPRRQMPLHTAAASGNVYAVMWLLHRAAPINAQDADGNTPLHCAVLYDQAVIVRLLCSKGALFLYNHRQLTPLALAIRWEKQEALKAFDEIQLSMVERIALASSYVSHRLSLGSRRRIESVAAALSPPGQVLPDSTDDIMQAMLRGALTAFEDPPVASIRCTVKASSPQAKAIASKKLPVLFRFPRLRQKKLGVEELSQSTTESGYTAIELEPIKSSQITL